MKSRSPNATAGLANEDRIRAETRDDETDAAEWHGVASSDLDAQVPQRGHPVWHHALAARFVDRRRRAVGHRDVESPCSRAAMAAAIPVGPPLTMNTSVVRRGRHSPSEEHQLEAARDARHLHRPAPSTRRLPSVRTVTATTGDTWRKSMLGLRSPHAT